MMPNAKDYKPKARLISVAGGPGTGKSTFILSASAVGKLAVALSPVAELDTYAGHDVEYEVFVDEGWQPFKDRYEASAYNRLMKWLDNIDKRKDIGIVGVDAMSAVSDLIMHEATKMNKTDNPMDIEHGRAYGSHNGMMKQLIQQLELIQLHGKHVIVSWHVQLRESEGAGEAKKVVDKKGNVEFKFEDRLLPIMHGSMRQDIAKHFSLFFHTKLVGKGLGVKYFLQAVPDEVAPAKTRVKFKEGVNPLRIPNDFKTVLEGLK